MLINMTAASAVAYFYFNWRYYALVTAVLERPQMPKGFVVKTFFLNYALFFLCSMMEWNLLVNWALFFVFQLAETVHYCKGGWRVPLFLSLNGVLYGLTVNIFCRCAVAVAIGQPLAAFDNHINTVGNLKVLPVVLGFLLGGVILHLMARPRQLEELRTLISHPQHLNFQLELMTGMFLYLFLNLLLYQSRGDHVLMKLWGIKSAIFSLAGSYLGLRYSLKMCRLSDYREQNRTIRQELMQSEQEEQLLRSMAYRDMLTGAYSRQYALDQLTWLMEQNVRFSLCFLDIDDLKGVNDRLGHAEGDRYLYTVAQELAKVCGKGSDVCARYGGDEFLLLFPDDDVAAVEARLQAVNQRLMELSRSGAVPFPMSFCFGVVDSRGAAGLEELLAAADARMYQRKKGKE